MDEREFVSLSDSGDRTVIVGEKEDGQRIYKVSSLAMSMASPIWKAMLNPAHGFIESNPEVPVEFPEDDPDALLILLRIAHLQFQKLPKSISFSWLVEIATLCDKYDNVGLVQPFIENWMSPWTMLCLEPGYEAWLFVAWTFGCEKIFNTLAASLVLSIELDSEMRIKNSGNEVLNENMPPGSIESILKAREDTITNLLNLFTEVIENLMQGAYCSRFPSDMGFRSHYVHGIRDSMSCNITNLGLFVKALYPLGLGSQKVPASAVKICISEILQSLGKASDTLRVGSVQLSCSLADRLQPKIKEILDNIPSLVQEQHKLHLGEQAKKSGIGDLTVPEPKKLCAVM